MYGLTIVKKKEKKNRDARNVVLQKGAKDKLE